MKNVFGIWTFVSMIVIAWSPAAHATDKKITVQGVIRRTGTAASDALINSSPTTSNAHVYLRCIGTCDNSGSATTIDYSYSGGGLSVDDHLIVPVKNGAFMASITPTATTASKMAQYKDADWYVVVDGQLDPSSASTTFILPIDFVPFAQAANYAANAVSADQIKGVTVDVSAAAEGLVLKYRSGQLVFDTDDNTGGGGGGGTYYNGSGLTLSGATFAVDSTTVARLTAGKISTSAIDTGVGSGQIPILDGAGKIASSVIPAIPMSSLTLGGTTGLVQLSAGKIPSGYLDSTSFAAGSINGSSIAPGTISSTELANGSVTNAKIANGAVDDTKISGVNGSKISGGLNVSGVTATSITSTGAISGTNITASGNILGVTVQANSMSIANQGELRLFEASGNGTNYLGLKAPAVLAGDLSWTMPDVDGGNGQVMKFNATTKTFYWANDAGASGSISGPGTSTLTAIARWAATDGSQLSNSGITIDGSDNLAGAASVTSTGLISGLNLRATSATASRFAFLDSSKNVTSSAFAVSDTEFGYLMGATSSIQTQLNAKADVASVNGKVAKTGDSMSGALQVGAAITSTGVVTGSGVNVTGATASRFAMFDGSKNVVSSAFTTTDTEFGYLSGVTSSIQTQINNLGSATNKVSKAGDSMSGALQVGAAITSTGTVTAATLNATGLTANRALATDGSKNLVASSVTDTELGYLSGATSNLQTQINSISGAGIGNKVSKTGDSMSGALQVGAAVSATGFNSSSATASRFAMFDASKNVISSAFTTTDTEFGYLSGVTAALQTQINNINTTTAGISGKVAKTGDSMSGGLQVGGTVQANTISLANQGELRLYEANGSGTNYLGLKAPATLAGDLSWIMPDVDGGNGQVMKFNATTKTFYWANDAGASGSISGPGTSTLTAIPRWAATDGSQLSNSGITIDGSDNLSGAASLSSSGLISGLNLRATSATASRIALFDSSKNVVSSAFTTTDTELGYLSGVTAALQTQINNINTTTAGISGKVAKTGDSMSGALQVGAAITSTGVVTGSGFNSTGATASRFAMFDGSKNVVSSAFTTTDTEFGYLSGVTAALQTQINNINTSTAGISGKVAKTGDSMSGALQVGAAITSTGTVTAATLNATGATASRIALFDSSKNVVSSAFTTTDTELGYLSGATSSIQTQINNINTTTAGISGKVAKTGDSMSGALQVGAAITSTGVITGSGVNVTGATANRHAFFDGSKNLVASAFTTTDTELGYLAGTTASVQTQINNLASGSALANGSVTTIKLDGTSGTEAVTLDKLRSTADTAALGVTGSRTYGATDTDGNTVTYSSGGSSKSVTVVTKVPLSMANNDCGTTDVASGNIVCAGF
ncbi:MAG: hypothetical protein JST16_14895 [Bdellovibrionales bacterium]|nr:hypothetical protein [Bdellovibrionales bacterium]